MNKKNYNIEELKLLIPDFITGDITEGDKHLLEEALPGSAELRLHLEEMKAALQFMDEVKHEVKHEEPSPAYWNSLIPRIHQRIDESKQSGFSWGGLPAFWKILVPAAAVILIAVIYYSLSPTRVEITKDDKQEIQQELQIEENKKTVKTDTSAQKINEELKKSDITPGMNNTEKSVDQKSPKKYFIPDRKIEAPKVYDDMIVKEESPERESEQINGNSEISNIDPDETAIFNIGESAGLDEETENELNKLKENEKDLLLEQLLNSNL